MPHVFLRSGRACLARTERALELNDVYALLEHVSRARQEVGQPLVLFWAFTITTKAPTPGVREALLGALPAVLSCVEELIVAIETTEAVRSALRAVFLEPAASGHNRNPIRLSKTLDQAFGYARELAPHDVIGLQQLALKAPS